MSNEAMKQALEAIESDLSLFNIPATARMLEAITALRTAIEQAEKQEPVAWVNHGENRITRVTGWDGYGALYTTPPAAPVREPDYKALYEKAAKQYNELAALMDQTAPVQEPKMYEDWYDSASCGHCGMVNGHTQHCRTVTRTAATKIRKYEPTIDLGKYAGTYGGYIKENDND